MRLNQAKPTLFKHSLISNSKLIHWKTLLTNSDDWVDQVLHISAAALLAGGVPKAASGREAAGSQGEGQPQPGEEGERMSGRKRVQSWRAAHADQGGEQGNASSEGKDERGAGVGVALKRARAGSRDDDDSDSALLEGSPPEPTHSSVSLEHGVGRKGVGAKHGAGRGAPARPASAARGGLSKEAKEAAKEARLLEREEAKRAKDAAKLADKVRSQRRTWGGRERREEHGGRGACFATSIV